MKPPLRNVPANPCTVQRFHHVGIAVRDIEKAIERYRDLFGLSSGPIMENADRTALAAVVNAGGANIELLQPLNEGSPFNEFLGDRDEAIHHICFAVESIDKALGYLQSKEVDLADAEPRRGFNGHIFFTRESSTGVSIELSELYPENRDT
ncbi:MAG: VOC family protein [Chloroflexi bacterium]|nr:VOC family protein [Chloroflexota bacterium]